MNEFKLRRLDGEYYADSREVAESIDKRHCDLLRSIKSYCAILTESKIALSDFFVPTEYEDDTGRKLPCYLITKKGCDMIANKLTGKRVCCLLRHTFQHLRKCGHVLKPGRPQTPP